MSKILIADDSAIAVKVQAKILEAHGYEVVVARDGIEATQAVYTERPDLVLLDIFMPRMNGYQVCRLLKHDPTIASIPVVINTSSPAREAEFWSLHTGADVFQCAIIWMKSSAASPCFKTSRGDDKSNR